MAKALRFSALLTVLCMICSFLGCNSSNESNEWEVYSVYEVSESTDSDPSQQASGNSIPNQADEVITESVSSYENSEVEKTEIEQNTDDTNSEILPLPSKAEMIQDMKGLNVLALGDSLFRGTAPDPIGEKVWINRLAVQCDWNITNLGWGGMTVSLTEANRVNNAASMYDKLFNTDDFVYGSKNSSFYSYGNTDKSTEEVDVIFIEGGCNDYDAKNNVALGGIDSNTKETFLGAWNLIVQKLMNDYPNATVIFLTTWDLDLNTRQDKVTSSSYSGSIKTLYEKNYSFRKNVKLIDMGNPDISGAYMKDGDWRNKYAFDRYHLNSDGMKIVCDKMLPHIWKALNI